MEETSPDRFSVIRWQGLFVDDMGETASEPSVDDTKDAILRQLYHVYLDRCLDARPRFHVLDDSKWPRVHTYGMTVAGVGSIVFTTGPLMVPVAHLLKPSFRAHVFAELERLQSLRAGWDGYRAPALNADVIRSARELVMQLSDALPVPSVVPLASGGLQLEWSDGQLALELEFETADIIRFLQWSPATSESREDTVSVRDLARIEALIDWFAQRNV
jgi:hypothetical protein